MREVVGNLVVVAGLPGTGKTTYATALAATTGGILVDKDTANPAEPALAAALAGGAADRDSAAYRTHVYPVTMACVRAQTRAALDAPGTTILCAPFIAETLAAAAAGTTLAATTARWLGVTPATTHTLWFTAPAATTKARMAVRGSPADGPKLAAWGAYQARLGAATDPGNARPAVDRVCCTCTTYPVPGVPGV